MIRRWCISGMHGWLYTDKVCKMELAEGVKVRKGETQFCGSKSLRVSSLPVWQLAWARQESGELETGPSVASLGQGLTLQGLTRGPGLWAGWGEPWGTGTVAPAVSSGHGQSSPICSSRDLWINPNAHSSAVYLESFRFRLKQQQKNLRQRFVFNFLSFLARQNILMMFSCWTIWNIRQVTLQ